MKIQPIGSPAQIPVNGTPEAARTAKAIAAFNNGKSSYDKAPTQGQAQEHPVQNPNQVSVEELSAIQATKAPEIVEERDKSTDIEAEVQAPVPEPKEDKLSRQFAHLARQERALRAKAQQQEQAYKQREAELAAREAAIKSQPQFDPNEYIPRSKVKQDALSVLDEAGVSWDELTQQALTRQPTDPRVTNTISRLEAKIAQLEKSAETAQQSYKDQQQSQYQAAVKQIENDARALVKHDPNFETIRVTGSVKDVVELITQTYDKDGILLTVEEAAQQVEDYLVEEATKLTQIGKIKARMAQANASQVKSEQKTQAAPKQTQSTMKTLTNATSSQRQLSAKERAILAFRGELKS